jgi:hypothetical protein
MAEPALADEQLLAAVDGRGIELRIDSDYRLLGRGPSGWLSRRLLRTETDLRGHE